MVVPDSDQGVNVVDSEQCVDSRIFLSLPVNKGSYTINYSSSVLSVNSLLSLPPQTWVEMMVVEGQDATCYLAKQSRPYILLGTNKYKQTQTTRLGSGCVWMIT